METTEVREYHKPPQPTHLNVDVFGVSMLLPNEKKVVLVDGRRGRIASDGVSVIPAHVPFLGIQKEAFDEAANNTAENPKPKIAFSYDVGGVGQRVSFECFLLDRHTVTFEGCVKHDPQVKAANIPRMSSLVGKLQLCPGVTDGTLDRVVGLIDFTNAESIAGADHGDRNHAIAFGPDVRNWAEKITANFSAEGPVQIRLKQPDAMNAPADATDEEKKNRDYAIILKPGNWKIMIANIPPEEVLDLHAMDTNGDGTVPLTHLELLYDLYHIGYGQKFVIPHCETHGPATMNGAHHIHDNAQAMHRVAGSGAHCGPPVTGG